jgi:exosortase
MPTPISLRLWMILVLAVVVAAVFWPSTAVLIQQWSDFVNITYTHGWLILAVCVWLVTRSGRAIAAAPARPWPLAQLALVLAVFAWLVCYRASIQDLHVTLFPGLFWLAVAAAFGWPVARLLIFPVAFFCFALPSWAQLGNPLQELTVLAMRLLLTLTGPAAVINGDVIHIPNGSFRIEEGCSGLHFMIVGLAVAALHGELRRDSWKTRLMELGLMAALALLANWVRVYTIIEAGYLSNMRNYLVSVSHYWFGWGVFAVALIGFFWLTTWLAPATGPAPPPKEAAVTPPPAADDRAELRGAALAIVLLAILPALSLMARSAQPPAPLSSVPFVVLPPPWSASPPAFDSAWWPDFAGADDTEYLQVQKNQGPPIEVFRVRYRVQHQGAELVGDASSLLGAKLRWRGEQRRPSTAGVFEETEVAETGDVRSLIWWRYNIAGRAFVQPLASQLWYGLNATFWSPPASLVALRAPCRGDCGQARALLNELISTNALR